MEVISSIHILMRIIGTECEIFLEWLDFFVQGARSDIFLFFALPPQPGAEYKIKNKPRNFFTVRVTKHLHRLPRNVVEPPSLDSKSLLELVQSN